MHGATSSNQFLFFFKNQVGGIVAILVSLVSGIAAVTKSLLPASERAAREFQELTDDPTKRLRFHLSLISKIKDPVIIFIDDLDRCRNDYTIRFLEGIQTMFREADVFYVIAADRRWLYSSYEKVYSNFATSVKEAGRPLGFLFLQKTFQLSVTIPRLTASVKASKQVEEKDDQTIKSKAAKDLEKTPVAENERRLVDGTGDLRYDREFRNLAVIRLEHPSSKEYTEHLLQPFANFEDNPRAMKRFVNAYRIARAIKLIRSVHVEEKKLALWTIISMRWPTLAEYILRNPQIVEEIRTKKKVVYDTVIDKDLQSLLCDPDVYDVVSGKGVGAYLDVHTIIAIAELQTQTARGLVT